MPLNLPLDTSFLARLRRLEAAYSRPFFIKRDPRHSLVRDKNNPLRWIGAHLCQEHLPSSRSHPRRKIVQRFHDKIARQRPSPAQQIRSGAPAPDQNLILNIRIFSQEIACFRHRRRVPQRVIFAENRENRQAHQQKEEYSLSIREGNGHFRIVLCNFDEEPAAYKKLNEFKRQDIHPNAWVLASK